MMKLKKTVISIIFIYALAITTLCTAQTIYVAGNINENTIWTADTIKVTGDLTVENGMSLTISPGCYVEFQNNYSLVVKGSLFANGTENDSIIFTTSPNTEKWEGIDVPYLYYGGAPTEISFCHLENVSRGIKIQENDSISLSNITIINVYQSGIYINGGTQLEINNVVIKNGSGYGLFFSGANVILNEAVVSGFTGSYGPACSMYSSTLSISQSVFQNNQASHNAGAIAISTSDVIMESCLIDNNVAGGYGGGIKYSGPLDYTHHLDVKDCVFTNNSSNYGGGAIYSTSNFWLTNCQFHTNTTEANGGAIYQSGAYPYIINSLFNNNEAADKGGAIYNESNSTHIINSTLVHNQAENGGGIFGQNLYIYNTILWANYTSNDTNQISSDYGNINMYYSNIQNGLDDIECTVYNGDFENCISMYPLFENETNDNFRLSDSSYCINSGSSDTSGMYLPEYDLDANPRLYNDRVDIGVYEYQAIAANRIPILYAIKDQYTNINEPEEVLVFFDEYDQDDINEIFAYSDSENLTIILPDTLTSPATIIIIPNNNFEGQAEIHIEIHDQSGIVNSLNSCSFDLYVQDLVELCGTIEQDLTLSQELVVINCDIFIPQDVTLTIMPGVKIGFHGFYQFYIEGNIIAIGSENDSIIFTAMDTIVGWKGLKFDCPPGVENDSSLFEYCRIEYCKEPNAPSERGTFFLNRYKKTKLSNCEIQFCYSPFRTENYSDFQIDNCHFHDNSGGVSAYHYCNFLLQNSIISNNTGTGVMVINSSHAIIEDNLIKQNKRAIFIESATAYITNNVIDSNLCIDYYYSSAGMIKPIYFK